MATAKSRSLRPLLQSGRPTLKEQVSHLWKHIVAAFIMEEPEEYAFHPDLATHLEHQSGQTKAGIPLF